MPIMIANHEQTMQFGEIDDSRKSLSENNYPVWIAAQIFWHFVEENVPEDQINHYL